MEYVYIYCISNCQTQLDVLIISNFPSLLSSSDMCLLNVDGCIPSFSAQFLKLLISHKLINKAILSSIKSPFDYVSLFWIIL